MLSNMNTILKDISAIPGKGFPMLRKIIIPIAIILLGYAGFKLFSSMGETPPRRNAPPRTRFVETRVVALAPLKANIVAYGRLKSAQPVVLTSEVSGTLQRGRVAFQPGQSFRKGDLLAKIDDREVNFDLNTAKSDFLTALATVLPEIKLDFPEAYGKWQQYFDSFDFGKPLAPLPAVEDSRIKLFLARFNIYKNYFNVQNIQIRRSKHFFYAPFHGSIVSAELRMGSAARPGTRLGTIINLQDMEVEVPVAVDDVPWIDADKPVIFTASDLPRQWQGRIKRIGRSLDAQTQTLPVYLSISGLQSSSLYEGAFLRAEIPGKLINEALEVPNKALHEDRFVYLINGGKLDLREVDIARKQAESVIIKSGVANGDTLVTELLQGVAPGMIAKSRGAASGNRAGGSGRGGD